MFDILLRARRPLTKIDINNRLNGRGVYVCDKTITRDLRMIEFASKTCGWIFAEESCPFAETRYELRIR